MSDIKKPSDVSLKLEAVSLTPSLQLSLPNGNIITGKELLELFTPETCPKITFGPDTPICTRFVLAPPQPPEVCPKITFGPDTPTCPRITIKPPIACPLNCFDKLESIWAVDPREASVLVRYGIISEDHLSDFQREAIKGIRTEK